MTTSRQSQGGGGFSEELRPYVDKSEAEGIDQTAERLLDAKPVPRTEFRTTLYAHLSDVRQKPVAWRPRRLGRLVAAYAGSGFVLLLVAALGLAGTGPLAY
jgi:hypothetical protein